MSQFLAIRTQPQAIGERATHIDPELPVCVTGQ